MAQSNAKAIFLMIASVGFFYVGDSFTRIAATKIGIFPTLFLRVTIGWLAIGTTLVLKNGRIDGSVLKDRVVTLRSLSYFFTIICFAKSFTITSDMTTVYIISFMWPLIVIIINYLRYNVRTSSYILSLNIAMFIGIVIFLSGNVFAEGGSFEFSLVSLIPLSTAVGYASIVVLGQKIDRNYDGTDIAFSAFSYSMISLFVIALIGVTQYGLPSIDFAIASTLVICSFCSTAGFMLFSKAMIIGDETVVAPFDYTAIVYSSLWNMYSGVSLNSYQYGGMIIIIVGAALLLFKRRDA